MFGACDPFFLEIFQSCLKILKSTYYTQDVAKSCEDAEVFS